MVYYKDSIVIIRDMIMQDIDTIHEENLSHGWQSTISVYEGYYNKQESKALSVFAAEYNGKLVGYTTLRPQAAAGPFANGKIPEISDFNVFTQYRRKGIGSKILDIAEHTAQMQSDIVCLGVGLHSGYGSAQRMYIKRGYIPDGSGVWYKDKLLEQYADCCNDDDLVLYLSKRLRSQNCI